MTPKNIHGICKLYLIKDDIDYHIELEVDIRLRGGQILKGCERENGEQPEMKGQGYHRIKYGNTID